MTKEQELASKPPYVRKCKTCKKWMSQERVTAIVDLTRQKAIVASDPQVMDNVVLRHWCTACRTEVKNDQVLLFDESTRVQYVRPDR